jgi:hypothetical protein
MHAYLLASRSGGAKATSTVGPSVRPSVSAAISLIDFGLYRQQDMNIFAHFRHVNF